MLTTRRRTSDTSVHAPPQPLRSVTDIVHDFAHQLLAAVERATCERAQEMAVTLLAQIPGSVHAARGEEARRHREQRELVAGLVQEFQRALEIPLQVRMRQLLAERLALGQAVDPTSRVIRAALPSAGASPMPRVPRQVRRRAPRPRLLPPPDPEQIRRDAEAARLRALLRPTAEEFAPPAPVPAPATTPVAPMRPTTPGDLLRALEKEIQDAVPFLAEMGPERCAARIAAWTGTVRELRDRLPPDVSATMRPAFRIFLEHLVQLREAMEAHVVDALEPSWNTPDWGAYVEVNRAMAEQRTADLPSDRLIVHHRTMLHALLKPHRKNVPAQAIPIIQAAAQVLPATDAQLRSAMRRHAMAWGKVAGVTAATNPATVPDKPASTAAPAPAAAPAAEQPVGAAEKTGEFVAVANDSVAPTGDPAPPADSEFDLPWTTP